MEHSASSATYVPGAAGHTRGQGAVAPTRAGGAGSQVPSGQAWVKMRGADLDPDDKQSSPARDTHLQGTHGSYIHAASIV